MKTNYCLEAALKFAAKDIPVFPCSRKKPLTESGLYDASTDGIVIREFFTKNPKAQVAIRTGMSSGIFALDLDSPAAFDVAAKWNLPPTLEIETRPGRKQLWFAQPRDIETGITKGFPCEGLDSRGDGGYCVAPPSVHHLTNKPYRYLNALPLAVAPQVLLDLHRNSNGQPKEAAAPAGAATPHRYDLMMSLAGSLRLRAFPLEYIEEQIRALNLKASHDRGITPEPDSKIREIMKYIATTPEGKPDRPRTTAYGVEPAHTDHDAKASWPEPMDEDAFYGIAGGFVRLVAPQSEADHVALLGSFLVAAGVLFGRNAWARVEDTFHYPAEAILLCGPTSGGRKGTSTNRILPIMASVQADFANRTLGGLSTGEGLIAAVKEKRMFGDEGTNANFLVFLPEFSSLLAVMTRTGNTLSAVIRQAWDGQRLEVRTRKDPLDVDEVNISFLCHVTREELLSELTATSRANGFGNRFLVPLVKRSKKLPEGGAKVDANPIIKRLAAAVRAAQGRGEVRRSDAARELWAKMYDELARERAGLAGSMAARAEAHVLRLSLLYALLDSSAVVDVPHLRAARSFWDYCEASLGFIFGDASGDAETDRMCAAMAAGPMSAEDFQVLFNRHKPVDWTNAKLAELVRLRRIAVTVKDTPKGQVKAWCLLK